MKSPRRVIRRQPLLLAALCLLLGAPWPRAAMPPAQGTLGDPPALGGLFFDTAPGPIVSIAGDVDTDGDLDVLSIHTLFGTQLVLSVNRGDGSFEPAVALADFPATPPVALPTRLQLTDLDHDGILDLLALPVAALLGDGAGGFGDPLPLDWPALFSTVFPGPAGDLDGDGELDLVLFGLPLDGSSDFVMPGVFLGQGDGHFIPQPLQAFLSAPISVSASLLDHDLDGRLDLLGAAFGSTHLVVMDGLGDGSFQPPTPVTDPIPGFMLNPIPIDLNQDGWIDVVFVGTEGPQLWVGLGGPFSNFLLQSPVDLPLDSPISPRPVAGDFDGDGNLDVVVSDVTVGGVWLFVGDGEGGLQNVGEMLAESWTQDLSVADMDADGRDDVIATSNFGDEFLVLHGSPDSFVDLGFGDGTLALSGSGSTTADSLVTLSLSGASSGMAAWVASLESDLTPFSGGMLVPTPELLLFAVGDHPLSFRWPASLQPGSQLLVQSFQAGKLSNALALAGR